MTEQGSVHLPFEKIVNCRDLGGMINKKGQVVKPGRLLRSANLHHASALDRATLTNMGLSDIADLRTNWEIGAEPDLPIAQAVWHHFPVVHESTLKNLAGGNEQLVHDFVHDFKLMMQKVYRQMIVSDSAITAWKNLFDLLKTNPKMVLFHCTQGKDRTGIAAALILHALDVEEDVILNDYLETNLYLTREALEEKMALSALLPGHHELLEEDVLALNRADPSYFRAADQAVKDNYGSWHDYLKVVCGLEEEDFEKLRSYYLEQAI